MNWKPFSPMKTFFGHVVADLPTICLAFVYWTQPGRNMLLSDLDFALQRASRDLHLKEMPLHVRLRIMKRMSGKKFKKLLVPSEGHERKRDRFDLTIGGMKVRQRIVIYAGMRPSEHDDTNTLELSLLAGNLDRYPHENAMAHTAKEMNELSKLFVKGEVPEHDTYTCPWTCGVTYSDFRDAIFAFDDQKTIRTILSNSEFKSDLASHDFEKFVDDPRSAYFGRYAGATYDSMVKDIQAVMRGIPGSEMKRIT